MGCLYCTWPVHFDDYKKGIKDNDEKIKMHRVTKCCKVGVVPCPLPILKCLVMPSPLYCGWDKFDVEFEGSDTVHEKILKMFGIIGFHEYNTFYGPPRMHPCYCWDTTSTI